MSLSTLLPRSQFERTWLPIREAHSKKLINQNVSFKVSRLYPSCIDKTDKYHNEWKYNYFSVWTYQPHRNSQKIVFLEKWNWNNRQTNVQKFLWAVMQNKIEEGYPLTNLFMLKYHPRLETEQKYGSREWQTDTSHQNTWMCMNSLPKADKKVQEAKQQTHFLLTST